MKNIFILFIFICCGNFLCAQQGVPTLDYPQQSITGLVGDGSFLLKTEPEHFFSVRGKKIEGSLQLPTSTLKSGFTSSFFPGGVAYTQSDGVRILYGVTPKYGFVLAIEATPDTHISLKDNSTTPLHKRVTKQADKVTIFFSEKAVSGNLTWNELQSILYKPYLEKLVIKTPNQTLDKAVLFSQYLLDLGFNGEFMLCELFRWLDIWARDLGSGLLPGGLVTGRADMARKSLEYDLRRYALMPPSSCKNSNDPSQGGTAEGIGWTERSIWNYYLYSGDKDQLRKDAQTMRPWVDFWISRDYDEDGLIIDVTEFMDHMIMMLTTNGVSTLAANAMYSGMLLYAAKIEEELGNTDNAARYHSLYERTINAINTTYWNENKGYFNNMELWDIISERSAQPSQGMLLKIGATDAKRTRRTLDFLKKNNWNGNGSITIVPKMNHVTLKNDQNMKIWPWWNMWEAEARFKYHDPEGGYELLRLATNTINIDKYPGLMEETLDLDGNAYGGNAFPTAAGNILDVVVKDLMGIEILAPGWSEIKVVPAVPASWKDYSCCLPIPGGTVTLTANDGDVSVTVKGKSVKKVFTTEAISVYGTQKAIWQVAEEPEVTYTKVAGKKVPALKAGNYAQFFDTEFHSHPISFITDKIDVEGLVRLAQSGITHLIIQGSRLPLFTPSGKSIRKALEDFTAKGGNIIFYGATVNAKSDEDGAGILGEQCGIIDWEHYLPKREKAYPNNWKSTGNPQQRTMSYQAAVQIPCHFSGKELFFEIGQLVGLDSLFINGKFVASYADMDACMKQEYPTPTTYPHSHKYKLISRMYRFTPDKETYEAFHFGEKNQVEIRITKDERQAGLTEKCHPNIGIETAARTWQGVDEDLPNFGFEVSKRKGVNYWGNEEFFNSWSTKQGLFGFAIEGHGIQFADGTVLAGMPRTDLAVHSTYTDFALFAPLQFEILAYTETAEHLLYPMETERYPCIVRVVNSDNGGGYTLITPAVTGRPLGEEIIHRIVGDK